MLFFFNNNDEFIGILTDGDIRRFLVNNKNFNKITYEDINKNFYFEEDCSKYISNCKEDYSYIPILKSKKLIGYISNISS